MIRTFLCIKGVVTLYIEPYPNRFLTIVEPFLECKTWTAVGVFGGDREGRAGCGSWGPRDSASPPCCCRPGRPSAPQQHSR